MVLCGDLADVLLVIAADDVAVVDARAAGVSVTVPPNLDPTRRAARVELTDVACEVIPGAAGGLFAVARTVFGAEAVGIASECTSQAAEYAKVRKQFGRVIATYQAGEAPLRQHARRHRVGHRGGVGRSPRRSRRR